MSSDQMASTFTGLSSSVTNSQNDDVADEVHHGCFLEEFKEAKEITTIISTLSNIYKDQIAVERALERFQCEPCSLFSSPINIFAINFCSHIKCSHV